MKKKLELAKQIIESDYVKIKNLTYISTKVGCNYNSLRWHFARYYGMTMGYYLNFIRYKKALFYLKNTDMKLFAIALEVGLTNEKRLIYLVKKYSKKIPSYFRN